MARLMFSDGMLFCLASAMIVRSRGFISGSPPPARAATVNSLMRRVKIFPRLASAAPFLCLMECHLEWPDMGKLQEKQRVEAENLTTHERRFVLPFFVLARSSSVHRVAIFVCASLRQHMGVLRILRLLECRWRILLQLIENQVDRLFELRFVPLAHECG